MHSSPPSKRRHTASSALEASIASDTKRRKITAEQGSGPAAAESIRYDPPSGGSCGEPAPVVPGSPAPSATVAVAPTLPPTESSDVAKVKKTTVLTVIKTVTTVTTTVTTRVSRASPRATSSAEEEPLGENPAQSAPSDSGVAAPAASDYLLSSSPRTRSGRVVLPGGVNASVTMQVAPLAEFQLSPPSSSIEGLPSPRSSQSTETEPSLPGTPARSAPIPDFARSPSTASSQASTVAPWSPQSPFRTRRQNRAEVVPRWYTEAVASDSDDSETAPLVGSPLPAARPSVASSSPGFTVVEGGSANQPRDEWQLETWPDDVQFISAQLNPRRWKFPAVSVGVRGGIGCGCEERCKASTCLNARSSRFCTEYNCTFAAECGNGLYESRALAIGRNLRTGMRGLVAKAAIPAGEVIGQYLGNMDLFGPPCINGPINDGYRMHLRTRSTGNKFVGIDALDAGGNLRFMNHACNPSARFHEVQTGQRLTVVAVTIRDVYPGEEVTVSYGNKLWFVCRCGWSGCQHRHLQQLPQDSESA